MKSPNNKDRKVSQQDEQKYYKEASAWESEIVTSANKRAKGWAWVAVFGAVFSSLCIIAILVMLPLKETVPYVIEVDEATGMVEVKRPLDDTTVTQSEAITKFFIVQYLNAREGYFYDSAQDDYVKVQKMSSADVAREHYQWFNPSNETSPLNVLGQLGKATIEIRSLSFLAESTASIAIRRDTVRSGITTTSYELVTLSFQYLLEPATEQDRFINPLGFQVTAYRIDPQLIQE